MKKLVSLILCLMMVLTSAALAEDTGIQIIGGPEVAAEVVNLDDMKVGQVAKIEGLGEVQLLSAEWIDGFASVTQTNSWGYDYKSGPEAQYLRLNIRILNTNFTSKNYHAMFSDVICDYGDGYQFKGWYRQRENDTEDAYVFSDSKFSYDVSPLYAGRYIVCVTLPNVCVDSEEPLSITFKIGENEFTYHERK